MSTKAQIKANQQNAQKSTGPQTAEGKAVVSLNAVKHGIFAGSVIQGEAPADYQAFHNQFLADLAPVGMAESVLAERVISLSWRLQRAVRMQNQSIDVMIALAETDSWQKMHREETIEAQDPRAGGLDLLLGWATKYDFSNSRVLDRLLLYERRIENSMVRMMKELKRFQVMRRIELQNVESSTSLRDEDATQSNTPSLRDEDATQSNTPSLRDEDAAQSTPARAIPIPINDNRDEAAAPKTEKHGDLKKQSQNRPSTGNPKHETRNPKRVEMVHLKKQSQYTPEQMGVTSLMKGDYNNKPGGGCDENKANRSQSQALESTKGVEKGKKSGTAANSLTG